MPRSSLKNAAAPLYKDGANGEIIIDAVLLLQTAEMSAGIEHNNAIRYLNRVLKVADELGAEVYESAPAPSPAAPAFATLPRAEAAPAPAAAPSAAVPSAAAAPDAAFLESVAAAARDKIKAQHASRVRGLCRRWVAGCSSDATTQSRRSKLIKPR